jgi:hypothetical protein
VRFTARLKADSSLSRALEFLVLTAARTGEVLGAHSPLPLRASLNASFQSGAKNQKIGVQ